MTTPLVLNDRYRLDRRLAAGGMGEVWQATDQVLSRSVAVKLLKQQFVADPTSRERFRAEARFAAALQHGGIAQVYDYGEQDELAYLVMELVPGEPLSKILTRVGRLAPEVTMDLIGQAARALHTAHTAGIIHRDIKPANLMVTDDSVVKITDFGIARGGGTEAMTQTGMVMGTAQYVSPEQATGQHITPASDLYSLGVVAYECLAGMPPFAADTPVALALKHVRDDAPPLPPQVPAPVRALVGELMSKEVADRPSGAQEVADRAYLIRESMGFVDDVTTAEDRAVRARVAATAAEAAVTAAAPTAAAPTTRSPAVPAGTTRMRAQDLPDEPPPRRGGAGRAVLVAACAVAVIGAAVFTAGLMWKDPRHSKLIDGNRTAPVPTSSKTHSRHGRHVPKRSTHRVLTPRRPTPEPSSTSSSPTPKPTRTTTSPKPTPTRTSTASPTTPGPTPTRSTKGG
jgi:eukaryotic-like serine/threonine-protein kinase